MGHQIMFHHRDYPYDLIIMKSKGHSVDGMEQRINRKLIINLPNWDTAATLRPKGKNIHLRKSIFPSQLNFGIYHINIFRQGSQFDTVDEQRQWHLTSSQQVMVYQQRYHLMVYVICAHQNLQMYIIRGPLQNAECKGTST